MFFLENELPKAVKMRGDLFESKRSIYIPPI